MIVLPLKYKLLAVFLLLTLCLVGFMCAVSGYIFDQHFQQYVQQQQQQDHQRLVSLITTQFDHAQWPSQSFLTTLGAMALDQGMVLSLLDTQGEKIFCMSCLDQQQCQVMLHDIQSNMENIYPSQVCAYEEQSYPILQAGVPVATVVLGYMGPFYYSDSQAHLLQMTNQFIFFLAVALFAVAIFYSYYFSNRITKPLALATAQAKKIQQGQYGMLLDEGSSTLEINTLITSINVLSETLEQQLQSKKKMAKDYAHEFRTPLAAIQTNLEGMIDGILPVTNQRLEHCCEEIHRLSRMIAQIDHIVSLETIALQKHPFDFQLFLQKAVALFEKTAWDQQIALQLDCPAFTLYGDEDQLQQVLINILSNSLKYTDKGGMVSVQVQLQQQHVLLTIQDDGIGISATHLPHIFEHLYRVDTSSNQQGNGIGLWVCKAIVEAHQGTIQASSILGQGTTITIVLPR